LVLKLSERHGCALAAPTYELLLIAYELKAYDAAYTINLGEIIPT